MAHVELGRLIHEGYICDGIIEALAKDADRLNDKDRYNLEQGIEYLEDAREGHKRILNGQMDENSVRQAQRINDIGRVMLRLNTPEDPEQIESKLQSYAEVLRRLKNNAATTEDEALLEEQRELFRYLGTLYLEAPAAQHIWVK